MVTKVTCFVGVVILAAALVTVPGLGHASSSPAPNRNPSGLGGPPHCWGGANAGPSSDPCGGVGGKPADVVDTFHRNLTISDMPVHYQSVGDAMPFVVYHNTRPFGWTTQTKSPMNYMWTHSYNIWVYKQMPSGVWVIEGNGQAHWFQKNAGETDYLSPIGVFDYLQDEGTGGLMHWTLTRPDGHVLRFRSDGRLTSIEDKDGFTWTLSYIEDLVWTRLSTISDPLGRETTLEYTYYANGWSQYLLTRVTVPGGLHADFTYDLSARNSLGPASITDAAGDTYQFTYNTSGPCDQVSSTVDPSGRRVNYGYEWDYAIGRWRLAYTVIDGLPESRVDYDVTPSGSTDRWVDVVETKDGNTRVTRHVHSNDTSASNTYGTLLAVIRDPGTTPHLNLSQNWGYDSNFRLIRHRDSWQPETGGKWHRHFYYYDYSPPDLRAGLVTKYIDPENSDASPNDTGDPTEDCPGYLYEYDTLGNITRETTPEGRVTDYVYVSGTRRLDSAIIRDTDINGDPVDRITSYTYYPSGDPAYRRLRLETMTDAEGNVTTCYYDANGYLDYVAPPLGGDIDYTYNSVGDVTAITDGNGNTTSHSYDEIHRLTQITYPSVGAGTKTEVLDWSCCGLDDVTDENGVVTKYEYDAYTHKLWKVHEDYYGLNYVTEYAYDEVGNLIAETNARGKTSDYTYDAADRKTRADYPDSTYETWTYRDDGRVHQHTDGRGRQTTYRYDADDRLAGSGGYMAIDYPNDTDVQIARDTDGLITSTVDASGTTTNVYYPSTWLKTTTVTAGTSKTLTYQYNGVGLVSTMTTPDDLDLDYAYNARNQLLSVTSPTGVAVSFTYDNGGRRTRVTRPGSYIEYVYNARDWQTDVRNRTTGGTTRYDATYEYNDGALWDHTGNPLKRVENFGGNDYTTTLRYDDVYRETEETKRDSGNNVTYTLGYGYDQVGNRTSLSKDGTTYTFVYDDNNKMSSASGGGLSASFGYDGAGSMTSVTGTMYQNKTLVFDDESRMSSITYGGVTDTYTYNWQGLRTRAYLNGTYYRYLYHGARVLQDLTDAGGLLATYTTENDSYYGTLLHIQRATGESRFPLYDEIGSARGLVDANGTVTDTYELDTFGRSVSSSGTTPNPYRFGGAWGYITDPSGMLQLGARYYWPEVGRFVQQDPIGDGVNWYAYVDGKPTRYVDPAGLTALDVGFSVGYPGRGLIGGLKIGCIPDTEQPCPANGGMLSKIWGAIKKCVHPYGGAGATFGVRIGATLSSGSPSHGPWAGQYGTLGIPQLAGFGPAGSFGAGVERGPGFSGGIGWGLGYFQGITYTL